VTRSGKQPTSGPVLMGKKAQKFKVLLYCNVTIQSVLDVRDDSPAPKHPGHLFNGWFPILTPDCALKFTVISEIDTKCSSSALPGSISQAVPEISPISQPTIPVSKSPQKGSRLRQNSTLDAEPFHVSHAEPKSQSEAQPSVPKHYNRSLSHNGRGKNTRYRVPPPLSFRGFSLPESCIRGDTRSTSSTTAASVTSV
jgi:hypothetical protein